MASLGAGMCIRVIMSSEILASFVRKVRRSALVAVQGRLPIQIPCSERFDKAVCSCIPVSESRLGSVILEGLGAVLVEGILPFLAFRSAFFEGGSGAVTSTSISSTAGSVRLRFLEGEEAKLGELDTSFSNSGAMMCGANTNELATGNYSVWNRGSEPKLIRNVLHIKLQSYSVNYSRIRKIR